MALRGGRPWSTAVVGLAELTTARQLDLHCTTVGRARAGHVLPAIGLYAPARSCVPFTCSVDGVPPTTVGAAFQDRVAIDVTASGTGRLRRSVTGCGEFGC